MHDIAPRARHLFIFCLCCEGGLSEGSRCRHLVDQISEINKASFFLFLSAFDFFCHTGLHNQHYYVMHLTWNAEMK